MSWAGLGTHLCPMGHLQASLREGHTIQMARESLADLPVPGLAEPGGLECCTSRASVSWDN